MKQKDGGDGEVWPVMKMYEEGQDDLEESDAHEHVSEEEIMAETEEEANSEEEEEGSGA